MSTSYRQSTSFLISILILFFFAAVANGQTESSTSQSTPSALAKGSHPLGSYGGSSFDKVNLFNGNLSLSFPLASLGGRNGLGVSVTLSYNSKLWKVTEIEVPDSGGNPVKRKIVVYDEADSGVPQLAPGWTIHSGRMFGRQTANYISDSCFYPNTTKKKPRETLTTFTFTAPDGTEYDFRDDLYDGAPLQLLNCEPQSRGTRFHSTDGTSAVFIVTSASIGSPTAEVIDRLGTGQLYPSGFVLLRNGTRFSISNGKVVLQRDSNGNIVRFEYGPDGNSAQLTKVTDTLGRTINIEYYDSTSPLLAKVTFQGVGGVFREIEIGRATLGAVLRPGQTLKTESQLFPDPEQRLFRPDVEGNFDPSNMVSYIELPSGHRWEFLYNSYGEVARVKTPIGGMLDYESPDGGVVYLVDTEIFRRISERVVYADGVNREGITTYSDPTTKDQFGFATVVQKQLDADGVTVLGESRHRFEGSPLDNYGRFYGAPPRSGYKPWKEGKEVKTIEFDGGVQKRTVEYIWEQREAVLWLTNDINLYNQPQNDPRLRKTITTLNDSGQVSEIESDYDNHNNITAERVYDYGNGTRGSLLRQVLRTYINSPNYKTDTTRLVSLVITEKILNGSNQVESLTLFEYDNYSSDTLHDALFPRTFTLTDTRAQSYDSDFHFRGNLTRVINGAESETQTSCAGDSDCLTVYSHYDIAGNVIKTVGPKTGQTVEIEYDSTHFAFPLSTSQPVGSLTLTTSKTYDFYTGALLSTTGYNGETTSYTYADSLDRLTNETRPPGLGSTSYSYSAVGQYPSWVESQSSLDPGRTIAATSYFDGLFRQLEYKREDPAGDVSINTKYDGLGRTYLVSNPHRATPSAATDGWTRTSFDRLGQVVRIGSYSNKDQITCTSPGCTGEVLTQYFGTEVTVTDQAGKQKKSVTDALGRLVKVYEPNTSGALSLETNYEYDSRGNLLRVLQGQQTRAFTYDELGRLKTTINPETEAQTTYTYDEASNLISRTDARGVITSYSYDQLDRVLQKTYSDSTPSVSYFYDNASAIPANLLPAGFSVGSALGRLAGLITSASGQTQTGIFYGYDLGGRILRGSQWLDGEKYQSSTIYNEASLPTSETYPSGVTVTTTYNNAGQVASVSRNGRVLTNVTSYAATGALAQQQLGNSLLNKIEYNNRLQPKSISLGTTVDGAEKLHLAYDFGEWNSALGAGTQLNQTKNNGNIGRITITAGSGTIPIEQNFDYDELNRIKLASEFVGITASWSQQFQYDRYGNRQCCSPASGNGTGTGIQISQATNRITEPGYVYDTAGNLTNEGAAKTYSYDAENRMISAIVDGVTSTYVYDGNGKRVKKIVNGIMTKYIYDEAGALIAEYSNGATITAPTKDYIYGASGLLAVLESIECGTDKELKYITPDHLGSPRIVTNLKGKVLSRHDYYPFGEEIESSLSGRNNIQGYGSNDKIKQKFTGYERDDETGLDFAQARYYSSSLGRFMSPDEFAGGPVELYFFASNAASNPTFYADIYDPQSLNKYQYCFNNPLSYVDPDGHDGIGTVEKIFVKKVFTKISKSVATKRAGASIGGLVGGAIIVGSFINDGIDIYTGIQDVNTKRIMDKQLELQRQAIAKQEDEKNKQAANPEPEPSSDTVKDAEAGKDKKEKGAEKSAEKQGKDKLLADAKKFNLNANSPTSQNILKNLDIDVKKFIANNRKSSIKNEFPAEFLKDGVTVRKALEQGGTKVRKLLTDSRFQK